jgi:hypothetical protein
MARIVMRVRLTNGDQTDVTYEDAEALNEDEVVERVLSILSTDAGVLRCRHGDRLVALFARGVATLEVAPQGAIL